MAEECKKQETESRKWDDFTPEIWDDDHLKHIRDAAQPFSDGGDFVYDPEKNRFGFQADFEPFLFIDQQESVVEADDDEQTHQIESQTILERDGTLGWCY